VRRCRLALLHLRQQTFRNLLWWLGETDEIHPGHRHVVYGYGLRPVARGRSSCRRKSGLACAAKASPIGFSKATLITAAYSTFLYQFDAGPISSDAFAKTQKYDTVTDLWASVAKIPTNRYNMAGSPSNTYGSALAATVGTAIYVCGGSPPSAYNTRNEAYYPVTDTWATKQAMPERHTGGAIGATSTKLYIAGGYPATSNLHIYDAAADTWALGALVERDRFASVLLLTGGYWLQGPPCQQPCCSLPAP